MVSPAVERVLAARALNRLDWEMLLEYTPDPIGDWERIADVYDGLAPSRTTPDVSAPNLYLVRPDGSERRQLTRAAQPAS